MLYTYPDYYRQFRCTADKCKATCCAGWQIVIDKKTLKKYGEYKGKFGNRLKNSVDFEEKMFLQYDKRCAFLSDDNLCDIYSEAGEDMLCRTCKRYPRHIEEFENIREVSLSLSCPEVAKIILNSNSKVTFLSKSNKKEENYKEFDYFLFSILEDSRDAIIDILQDRAIDIKLRMIKMLGLVHDVQIRINSGETFAAEDVIQKYQSANSNDRIQKKILELNEEINGIESDRFYLLKKMYDQLYDYQVLDKEWPDFLDEINIQLFDSCTREAVCNYGIFDGKEIIMEQLLVYFVFTYYLGAVYDGDACSKIKMAVIWSMHICMICKGLFIKNGSVSMEDIENVVYRFSREIEHSEDNINLFEEKMLKLRIFSTKNIMKYIINL